MSADSSELRRDQAQSFGVAATVYERARPGYPEAALDWLLPEGSPRVVDLGAGTGKLTRQIAARGVEVIAVEPSDGMRDQLRQTLPEVQALPGSAERISLPDGSVDAVLVAQAWHWVDVGPASAEVARVLRPGGCLGLVWNSRDISVDWVAKMTKLTPAAPTTMDRVNPEIAAPFTRIEHNAIRWATPMTPDGLVELAATRSGAIVASDQQRDEIFESVRELCATHPDLAGRESFELPYIAYCTLAYVE